MAIFEIDNGQAKSIKQTDFKFEKHLQEIIENNIETIFNCSLIDTEFSTGSLHAGRIDTLALSEDKNPVIIEYKKVPSSELINQSLYYLHWLQDHIGEFQVEVSKKLGKEIEVDDSSIRVICIAPEYKKYDLHAVQVMRTNIELWQYKYYENGILSLEEIFKRSEAITENIHDSVGKIKSQKMVDAGNKAVQTRRAAKIKRLLEGRSENIVALAKEIMDYIKSLNVVETLTKDYIAYKTTKNFVYLEICEDKIVLYLKINPDEIRPFPPQAKDVRNSEKGVGDLEVTLRNSDDFEMTKNLIDLSLRNIGG